MRLDVDRAEPFARQWMRITKQEYIDLRHKANYWEAQHKQLKAKFAKQEQEIKRLSAKNKDLQHRLFGIEE